MRLDRKFVRCVYPIGIRNEDDIDWVGTGLLYGKEIPREPGRFHVFLVTNRHVVDGKENLVVRLNSATGEAAEDYGVGSFSDWELNEEHDVAVRHVPLNVNAKIGDDIPVEWIAESETWNLGDILREDVTEGDPAFVVGFPLGIVGVEMAAPIVRSASLARIQDTLAGHSPDFLIDSAVFPGNSGGPCLVVPIEQSIIGVQMGDPKLIGLVSAYVPYNDVAVSQQTGEARVIFTEHSGLSHVVPFDRVDETVLSCAIRLNITDLLPQDQATEQEWDTESFLTKLGYSVRKGGPDKRERRRILHQAVQSHGLSSVAGHIGWLIRRFSSRPDAATYQQAIDKWRSDFKTLRGWYDKSDEKFRWPSTN